MACVVFQVMSRRWRDSGDGGWLARRPSAGVLVDFETESILNIIQSHPLSRVVIWFIGYDTPEGVLTHICVVDRVECSTPPHGPP